MKNITIITPTLNSEEYLEDCINSVKKISKKFKNINHIIVDSYSNDTTLEIAKKHNLKVINCPPGNIYEAINMGIKSTNDEWITYINSDDFLDINLADEILLLDNKVDIFSGSIEIINLKNKINYISKCLPKNLFHISYKVGGMPIPQSGTIFSRKLFNKLNGFDTSFKYAADLDFFSRAFLINVKYKISKSKVATIRIHNNQLSNRFKLNHFEEIRIIRKNLFKNQKFNLLHKLIYKIFAHLNRSPIDRIRKNFYKFIQTK